MQRNRLINYLPYLIVIIAVMSLFSMNSTSAVKQLTYQELHTVLKEESVTESAISIGRNTTTVKGVYKDSKDQKITFSSVVPSTDVEISGLVEELGDTKLSIVDAEASNVFLDTLL